jgi:hypothetical protein
VRTPVEIDMPRPASRGRRQKEKRVKGEPTLWLGYERPDHWRPFRTFEEAEAYLMRQCKWCKSVTAWRGREKFDDPRLQDMDAHRRKWASRYDDAQLWGYQTITQTKSLTTVEDAALDSRTGSENDQAGSASNSPQPHTEQNEVAYKQDVVEKT